MPPRFLVPLCALLFAATACVEDVGKDKTAAVVAEPAPAAPVEAAPAAPVVAAGTPLPVDHTRSKIRAVGAKVTRTHDLDFDRWSGNLRVEAGALTGLDVRVEMASLRSDSEKLTGHLHSADFFAVDVHPTATFVSTAVVPTAGADGSTHTVSGDLTMHGVTKNVSFPATVSMADGVVKAVTEFTINRHDFGISYPGKADDLIQDNVVMRVELVASGA